MDAPPAAQSCWVPPFPKALTPVMTATSPPSWVFWPDGVTRLRPSIMHMYFCSGVAAAANGALSPGSVKLVVVAEALGRQVPSPGPHPRGWWMMRRRRGAAPQRFAH